MNEFKKKDADGNQLPEEIGKGLNYEHPAVKEMLDERMEFHLNKGDKKKFVRFCKPYGGVSEFLRQYIKRCTMTVKK